MTADEVLDAGPVLPVPDDLTKFFWTGAADRKLLIQRCSDCGHFIHPPKPVCSACLSFDLEPAEVSGQGTVYSYTVGVKAFHPWFESRVPYLLAVIELREQKNLKIVSNLVECSEEDARIGMLVDVEFEEISPDVLLPVFKPSREG